MPAVVTRVVLAYSGLGGPGDSDDLVTVLRREHAAEVITVAVDLGHGKELEAVRDRALAGGALRAHVLDARDEFAREYVLRALKADALRDDRYSVGAELGRLILAQKTVEIAGIEGAAAVAHSVPQGRSAEAFERAVHTLDPRLRVVALAESRAAAPVEPPPGIEAAHPGEPALVEISFDRGTPAALNGVQMPLVDLIATLGAIAAAHGVGGADAPPQGTVAFETAAAVVLHAAHRALEGRLLDDDVEPFAALVRREYPRIIVEGRWFSPLREALDAFVDRVQVQVTGVAGMKLFKGKLSACDAEPGTSA
jgi:argininosuccinate synthase